MKALDYEKTKRLLLKYKIPFCKGEIAKTKKEALRIGEKIGYPLVVKISSPDILHKTERNGVRTGIENKKELGKAFDELSKKFKKGKIEGILIQEFVKGKEIILGMKRDIQFGPVLMFGLGGIFCEILKDISFAIAPVSKKEALQMIKEIKAYPLLRGYRGEKGVNIKKLVEIIVAFSKLSLSEKEIKEIDLNPLIVDEKKASVVDAKVLI